MTMLVNRSREVQEKFFQTITLSGQIADILTGPKLDATTANELAGLQRRRAELKALIPPFQVVQGGRIG